jgi:hypothetical protein
MGCHYEGVHTCNTCGTTVCPDAGAVVCTGASSTFPTFDRACATASDCFIGIHQSDCCGSHQALGITISQRSVFLATEMTCEGMYPACGCIARPTQLDDATTTPITNEYAIVAACDSGRCTTRVPRVPTRHRPSDAACALPPAALGQSPSQAQMGCGGLGGYYCHTPRDLCVNDGDCPSASGPQACAFVAACARWECTTILYCP